MDEAQPVQGMALVLYPPVHVHAATAARVSLDGRGRVHDLQLVRICGHAELVARHHRDLREERAGRLPAFRAAASVVMSALARNRHDDLLVGAFAIQRAASEVWSRGLDAIVDRGMDGNCHVNILLSIRSYCESSAPANTAEPQIRDPKEAG